MGRWQDCEGSVCLLGHRHTSLGFLALLLPALPHPRVPLLLAEDARHKRTGAEPGLHSELLFLAMLLASLSSSSSPT